MSDTAISTPVSDVTADSSPAPVDSALAVEPSPPDVATTDAGGFDFSVNDADFDKMFGLEPEVKETPVAEAPKTTTDVKAPDQPATRQGEEPIAPPETEALKAEATDKDAKDEQFTANDKLNWDSSPKQFRDEHKALKEAFTVLAETHPQAQFLQDPVGFANWMKETSPTSYLEVGKQLATESAEQHPKEWAEYLHQKNPDLLAEIVTGKEGMTAEKLKAELSLLSDEDEPDIQAQIEKRKATQEPVKEKTPEEKRIAELLEREEQREAAEAFNTVFTPIESAVNALVSQAGLEVDFKALQGQDFTKLSEDDQFKFAVNSLMADWIDRRMSADPRLAAMQARVQYLLATTDEAGKPKARDVQSAKKLIHPLQIAATNFANEYLATMTGKRATAKQEEVKAPNPTPQAPQVKSTGAGQAFIAPPTGEIDWSGAM